MSRILVVSSSVHPMFFPLALLLLLGALTSSAIAGQGHGDQHKDSKEIELLIIKDASGDVPAASGLHSDDATTQREAQSNLASGSSAFSLPLPANLPPEKRKAALAIIAEAEPRLAELHRQMSATLIDLHNLSFAEDTPPEELSILGRKLVLTRNAILMELKTVCKNIEHQAGFNPGWGSQRSCAFRHQRDCEHQSAPLKSIH